MTLDPILFVTNVGSHLWHMETPESDVDLFECFAVPTRDILRGTVGRSTSSTHTLGQTDADGHPLPGTEDLARHEVGKVVDMLISGNVNYLWGVFSPIVVRDDRGWLASLRRIAPDLLSRQSAKSILGLAKANRVKYVESGRDASVKRIRLIARTLKFGITLMETGTLAFDPVYTQTVDGLIDYEDTLKAAVESSVLPERPPSEAVEAIRDWLLSVRIAGM